MMVRHLHCFPLLLLLFWSTIFPEKASSSSVKEDHNDPLRISELFSKGYNIRDYLNPDLFENELSMKNLHRVLDEGRVVIIRNAFRADFADYAYRSINGTSHDFDVGTHFFGDGFSYTHTNVWHREDQDTQIQHIHDVFTSLETRQYMSDLLRQDTLAEYAVAAPSHYRSGDYSGPHSDLNGPRKVAFVWHLTKNSWKPDWGGALYWCMERPEHAYVHASYNTLILFETRGSTQHFVTRVSPHATEKRLAFNGWWHAIWNPLDESDEEVELYLQEPEYYKHVTALQFDQLLDRLKDMRPHVSEEHHDYFNRLMDPLRLSLYPIYSQSMFVVDGNEPRVDHNVNPFAYSILSQNNDYYEDDDDQEEEYETMSS